MSHIDDEPCTLAADSFELLARLCPDGVLIIVDDSIVYACPAADIILSPPPRAACSDAHP